MEQQPNLFQIDFESLATKQGIFFALKICECQALLFYAYPLGCIFIYCEKSFAPITVLICLSLIGIIFIQVSWIRNMVQ
ncbi:MAG: hypothetical protein EBV71_08390, partial [Chitinophagia bacterium]|nr:hypothetical protein [Chitinophagia bacterium]